MRAMLLVVLPLLLGAAGGAHAAPAASELACHREGSEATPTPLSTPCETPGADAVRTFSERVGTGRYEAALDDAAPALRHAVGDRSAWADADRALRGPIERVRCSRLQYAEGDAAADSRGMTVDVVLASGVVLREQYRVARGTDATWRVADYAVERVAAGTGPAADCRGALVGTTP